ncbi:MAG: DUF2277 domain-containing protein [Acidobacteriaceae bacterium]
MCRSIHTLYHIEPPASRAEIRAAALQYVRKISGFAAPSKANEAAFMAAVDQIEVASAGLIASLHTHTPLRARATITSNRR